jgi:hypothetical protein
LIGQDNDETAIIADPFRYHVTGGARRSSADTMSADLVSEERTTWIDSSTLRLHSNKPDRFLLQEKAYPSYV